MTLGDWITALVVRAGYAGVAALMLAENVFPPIPSELIMPLAGFQAASGRLSLVLVIAAGSLGSLAGATFWYLLAKRLGYDRVHRLAARHGRWLTMTPADIDLAREWFATRGGTAVLLGRLVPTVRSLVSIPAGIAGMPVGRFLALSAVGVTAWTTVLATAGFLLRQAYSDVGRYLDPVATLVMSALVLWYAIRVWRFDPGDDVGGR
ncbi:DedA family protein [Sphingomonas sp. MA1305]|uniref:DedA family protein n=1 Tax=Sphingomonas sp. MA1305 TaxID=2479204 RepID=UPI003FA6D62F